MTPIEKVIELLKDHQTTGDREPAVEAHSLLGVFLDIRNEAFHKTARETLCIDCGEPTKRKSTKEGRCQECQEKRKKAWKAEYDKIYSKLRKEKATK